jgi:hypothetical protein
VNSFTNSVKKLIHLTLSTLSSATPAALIGATEGPFGSITGGFLGASVGFLLGINDPSQKKICAVMGIFAGLINWATLKPVYIRFHDERFFAWNYTETTKAMAKIPQNFPKLPEPQPNVPLATNTFTLKK